MALPAVFEPLAAAPRWQRALLGLLGLVVLTALAYFLVLSPLQLRVDALQARRLALETELIQARAAAADVARARREAADLEQQIAVLKERLPGEKDMPPLFRALTDAAFQSGLAVSLFQPREGRTHDYYVEYPIAMTAEGGYHQLGEFFERIAGLPRVVNVQELKATGLPRSKNSLRADLTLATYTYRPVGSPPAPKPGQPGAKGK